MDTTARPKGVRYSEIPLYTYSTQSPGQYNGIKFQDIQGFPSFVVALYSY